MIILIGSQKGGSDKSTTTVNISAWLADNNKDVCLVDADRHNTASNWVADQDESGDRPKAHCVQKYDNTRETLKDLNGRYEYVIVDKDFNPDLKVHALVTMAPSNPVVNETQEAKEYLSDYPNITLLKTIIRDRKVYRDGMSAG